MQDGSIYLLREIITKSPNQRIAMTMKKNMAVIYSEKDQRINILGQLIARIHLEIIKLPPSIEDTIILGLRLFRLQINLKLSEWEEISLLKSTRIILMISIHFSQNIQSMIIHMWIFSCIEWRSLIIGRRRDCSAWVSCARSRY